MRLVKMKLQIPILSGKKKSVDKYVNNIFHRLDINILNGIIGQLANLICVWK